MKYLLFGLVYLAVAIASESYEGYKVYTVTPKTNSNAYALIQLEKSLRLDFWSHPRALHRDATVMVRPEKQKIFETSLRYHRIPYKVLISNVKRTLALEEIREKVRVDVPKGEVSFTKFMKHHEINSYLDALSENYPDIVTLKDIGKSYENRSMKLLKISGGQSSNKPTIFIDAGIHAREWIAPAVALYVINQLVENATNKDLYENVDWIILPSVNPDGYEYTRSANINKRFWRKTRSEGVYCYGADANRNFGFHWMEEGADDEECSDIYAGSEAFSEVEARNLRDFLLKNNEDKNIKLYLSFHSYGEYILYPWGYAENVPDPENLDELVSLANSVRDAILAVRGTDYLVGNSAKALYPAAGGSDDWAKGVAGIPLAYTFELPGGGSQGFNPPPSRIAPIVEETWEGVKAFQKHIEENYARKGRRHH